MQQLPVKLEYIEIGFHLPILALSLISIFCGRRLFWFGQSILFMTLGVGLIAIPQYIIAPHLTGAKADIIHQFVLRMLGSIFLGYGMTWFLTRNSTDTRMTGSHMFAKIVGMICASIATFYSTYHLWGRKSIRFNEKFLAFYGAFFGLSSFGSLVHALRAKDLGGYSFRPDWLNVGLMLDHATLLVIAMVNFAFPSQILKLLVKGTFSIDGVHICIVRILAGVLVAVSLSSSMAAGFAFPNDKKAQVLGRLLTHVTIFALNLFGHFYLDIFTMFHVTPFMMSGFYITFMLTLYFRFEKEKKR